MKLKNQKSNIDWETRLGKFGASDIAQILPEPIQNKVYKTKPDRYGYTDYTVNEKGEYVVDGHKYYELPQVAISLIERKQTEIFYGKELRSPSSQAMLWGHRWEVGAKMELVKRYNGRIKDGVTTPHSTIPNMVGTPDCFIGCKDFKDRGVEIKCPFNEINHYRTYAFHEIKTEYKTQMQVYMMIFNKKEWIYASFDPDCIHNNLFTHLVPWDDVLAKDIAFIMDKINEKLN